MNTVQWWVVALMPGTPLTTDLLLASTHCAKAVRKCMAVSATSSVAARWAGVFDKQGKCAWGHIASFHCMRRVPMNALFRSCEDEFMKTELGTLAEFCEEVYEELVTRPKR